MLITNFLKRIIRLIYPNYCLSCQININENGYFCSDCYQDLKFISVPKCDICSKPIIDNISNRQQQILCVDCIANKPNYDKIFTIFAYNYLIKKIIINLKYHRQTSNSKKIAQIIYSNFANDLKNFDLIIAVPLHLTRLRKRHFNQSTLIAKHLAIMLDQKLKFHSKILVKTKNTKPQTILSKKSRIKNLKNAFTVPVKYRHLVIDKKVLLIDDVITTGTTIDYCSKTLKKFKAKEVAIASFAKNVK